jgi:carboxylesterase
MDYLKREALARKVLMPVDAVVEAYISASKALGIYDRAQALTYRGMSGAMRMNFRVNNDLEIEGAENVPTRGGMLFASNHQSWLDVQVLGASSPRRVHFVAKSEFRDWPVLRHLVNFSDSIFITRGGDREGLEQIVSALREGKAVAIYPEGTIPGEEDIPRRAVDPKTGLLKGHTGAVRMAIRARVPIIPVGVSGTGRALPPEIYPRLEILRLPRTTSIRIRFGEPIRYDDFQGRDPDHAEIRRLTDELMSAISRLVDHRANYVPLEVPIPEPPKHRDIGVLLLHGFTSSLDTVSGLVPFLEKERINYRMPLLRGHGTTYQDMRGVGHREWFADAERALIDLWNEVDRIVVVGLSMGGLVALDLGMKHPDKIAGVVTVAACLKFLSPLTRATPILSRLVKYWPSPESFHDPELAGKSTNYPRFATDSFVSLYDYSKIIARRLPELHVPVRILQSKADQIVDPESANIIYEKVSSNIREIVWFQKSGHEMMMDMEAEKSFGEIMEFVLRFRL